MAKKKAKKRTTARRKTPAKRIPRQTGRVSQTMAIVALILNILIIPGLGSLIAGKTKAGIWQFVLLFGGIVIGIMLTATGAGAMIGVPLIIGGPIAAWIWGLITGIQLIQNAS